MPGVHCTVWILAMSAALMSRARWNSSSSPQVGFSARSRSQIALCSSVKSVCITLSPIHQLPLTPVWSTCFFGSSGSSPSGPTVSLPSTPERSCFCVSRSLP
jgi:hypothetical protein